MAVHLVTGYAGAEHVAAADDATLHASVIGTGKYVFDSGNKFACEIVSNNLITIKDGDLMNQGRHIKIAVDDYEELTIDNGLSGVKRYDLICMRYNKNVDTNIEYASLVVIKGTSSESPTDPEYISGDILGGESVDDFPLYRVRLNGLNIEGVDFLFGITPNLETIQENINCLESELETKEDVLIFENSDQVTFEVDDGSAVQTTNKTFSTEEEAIGYVIYSSWYGSFNRQAYKAFDGSNKTQWCCQRTDNMKGEYIGYNFGKLIVPDSLKLVCNNSNGSNPSFIIQGCKDTVFTGYNEWVDLTDEISKTTNGSFTETFDISSDEPYAMYRILFTAGKQSEHYGVDIYEITITGTIIGSGKTVKAYVPDLASIQTDITALQSKITALQSSIETLQSDITAFQSNIETIDERINSEIATLDERIDSEVAELTGAIGNINNNISALDARLTVLEG